MTRVPELLRSWQGRGRAAHWRRIRARRLLSALLAALAVLIGWHLLAPKASATRAVAVASRDLPAGHRLTRTDVHIAHWPATVHLPHAVGAGAGVGRVLTAPVRAGEPLSTSRLRTSRDWPGVAPGQVLVGVPASDRALLAVLQPGDRLDLLAPGRSAPVASGLVVVAVTTPASGSTGIDASTSPGALLVACTPQDASRIAGAQQALPTGAQSFLLAVHPGA